MHHRLIIIKCLLTMQKTEFSRLISAPESLTLRDKMNLQSEKMKFPYCAPLQILDVVGDKVCGMDQWETKTLPIASLYVRNRNKVEELIRVACLVEERAAQVAPEADAAPDAPYTDQQSDDEFDIFQEINAYQEVSFKTAPKSVILSNFLDIDVYDTQDIEESEHLPIEVLVKNSVSSDIGLETETLALVFEKQGKYDKAVDVYKKLMVKYPEKSSTFATRIIELEKIIENSKK